ncbi:Lysosomal thioesterase PPT2-A [Phytophthora cinnamomi]|uniref:Lysosomal thioesterase PPT2-A n=1 Tax=Phytophthora cinnamomi TaxID=4785 RepID=UPI00355945C1|nr:Lysosomal thioesterase PPT2-A [Phytophthora cinnamomi]
MDPFAAIAVAPMDPAAEVTRLKGEVQAKDEALNALKAKTKAFVDNMRSQLANETKKVTALEEKLKQAAAPPAPVDNGPSQQQQQGLTEEIEKLKKETAARENELKTRAKSFADAMNSQLEAEKEKCRNLESQLQQKTEALAAAKAAADQAKEMDFLAQPAPVGSHTDEEFNALQSQLNTANFEMADIRERLRSVEAEALQSSQQATSLRQELEALRVSAEQQRSQLQAEVDALKAREISLTTELSSQQTQMKAEENSLLEADMAKIKELGFQLEQHKIENQHLQKQLSDKDFQLEQLDNYRLRADESESKVLRNQAEIASLQSQLQAKADELASYSCGKCTELEDKLAEITQLYEKVNLGRSRSDSLIAETQSQLGEMQTIKQQYVASQERLDDMMKQNLKLNEKISEKEIEVSTLKAEMKKWSMEMAELQAQHTTLKSDSSEHRQRSESVHAEFQKAEGSLKELQTRGAQLEKKNQELLASIEAINKENTDKRQKAKALVQALVSEKTNLLEAKSELQKEVNRLRMEVNQRNVDNEQQVKELQEQSNEKAAQSASTIQSLTDEIASLKHTLATVQESEKAQQRAKDLAAAKREIEDSNKKRLAAKAETQKLAAELENVHKSLDHITTHVNANCTENIQQIALVHGHVTEALEVLEKRVGIAQKQRAEDDTTEIVRKAEALRTGNGPQSPGAKRLEENVSRVSEQIRQLVDITERLCDIAVEQNETNLKDVIINTFTQCFSDKLTAIYSKADEAVSLLGAHGPTSEGGHPTTVRPS